MSLCLMLNVMLRIMYCSICYHYYPCHVSCSIRSTWESSCWCCSVLSISHLSFSLVFDIERMSFWLLTLVRPLPAVQLNFWVRRAALFPRSMFYPRSRVFHLSYRLCCASQYWTHWSSARGSGELSHKSIADLKLRLLSMRYTTLLLPTQK